MEKKLITISLLLLFQQFYGQENFMSGHIISLNGNSIEGFIDYRNWESNPDKIYFRQKLSDEKSYYNPTQIKGFAVKDEVYESATIKTELSTDNSKNFNYDDALLFGEETTFLQTMIQGPKSLYHYKNSKGKELFYIKNDSVFELLIHKKYLKQVDGATVINENKRFLNQLAIYFQDTPSILPQIRHTNYTKKSIENIFNIYYKTRKSEIKFQNKTKKLVTEFGFLTGLTSTSIKFRGNNNFDYLVNTNFDSSKNMAAGLFLNVVLPGNQGKWSIYNELMYNSYKVSGSYENSELGNLITNTTTSIGFSQIKINNMIRFKYPIGNLFLFLNTGMSNGFVISEINNRKIEKDFYTIHTIEEKQAIEEANKFIQSFPIGFGVNYKKYSFETRFENESSISPFENLTSTTSKYSFLLSYKF